MAKKSTKKGLIQKEPTVSADVILAHPVVKDVRDRLENLRQMLTNLPAAIGAGVAEATKQAPQGASGPPVELLSPEKVEILPRKLVLDGKASLTGEALPVRSGLGAARQNLNPGWSISHQSKEACPKCKNTGIWETGNNDLPCSCPAGKKALFNVAGIEGLVTGEEMEKHLFADSPEPLSSAQFNAKRKGTP